MSMWRSRIHFHALRTHGRGCHGGYCGGHPVYFLPDFPHPTPRSPDFERDIVADGNDHLLVDGIEGDRVDDAVVRQPRHFPHFRKTSIPKIAPAVLGAAGHPVP